MCGIVGVLTLDTPSGGYSHHLLEEMVGTIKHRGPDYVGIHHDGPCGLAHSRLSIIDLSPAARQPMTNESGAVIIAYNGEIYNFQELRNKYALDQKGHIFKSKSDTEVILHLYEEIGIDCLKEFNGMYAFSLWDRTRRTLFLARDPFGIKPLFYLKHKNALWFASEIKALLKVPGFVPRPNLEALHHYLSFDYIPGELTAFEDIRELRPGHVMTVCLDKPGQEKIQRFFDIRYEVKRNLSEAQAVAQTQEFCREAVKRHLISDVPVGVMLSGGLDSSAMTALMAQVRGDSDFHTFSLAFDEPSFNESDYARLVAEHTGTTHHEIRVTPEKVAQLLPEYLSYIDEPYADGSAIPTYLLAQYAKQHVTVLLSGEGGDEFFAGYDTHLAYKIRRLYRRIPSFFRKNCIRPLVDRLPVSHKKLSLDFKAKRFVRGAELDVPDSHFYWRVVLSEDAKKEVLNLQNLERLNHFSPSVDFFKEAYQRCEAADDLNRLLYIDYSYHLPDDLMIKNDRMTMAHSLEARVPFTDVELVRFLSSVPVELKLKNRKKKYLLKSALKGLLPNEILEKKKVGLEMPYSQWMVAELRHIVEDTLSESSLHASGLFNPRGVRRLWEEHLEKRFDHGRPLWGLLNYMLWYKMYIGRS